MAKLRGEQHAKSEKLLKTDSQVSTPGSIRRSEGSPSSILSGQCTPWTLRMRMTASDPGRIPGAVMRSEETLSEFQNAAAMYKSATLKRQTTIKADNRRTSHMKLYKTKERDEANTHIVQKKGAKMREPSEFYKVAARISTNRDFVQKFEELAVAVTSESIMPFYGSPRFAESQESSQLRTISNALLTRDPKNRSTAAEIAALCKEQCFAFDSGEKRSRVVDFATERAFQNFPDFPPTAVPESHLV